MKKLRGKLGNTLRWTETKIGHVRIYGMFLRTCHTGFHGVCNIFLSTSNVYGFQLFHVVTNTCRYYLLIAASSEMQSGTSLWIWFAFLWWQTSLIGHLWIFCGENLFGSFAHSLIRLFVYLSIFCFSFFILGRKSMHKQGRGRERDS